MRRVTSEEREHREAQVTIYMTMINDGYGYNFENGYGYDFENDIDPEIHFYQDINMNSEDSQLWSLILTWKRKGFQWFWFIVTSQK